MFFPAKDYRVLDTWSVMGLRGTASHDYAVEDAFVPHERTLSFADAAVQPGELYSYPLFGVLSTIVSSVSVGIARGAIEAVKTLANDPPPGYSPGNVRRDRALVQIQIAEAEADQRAARALLRETLREIGAILKGGRACSTKERALLRLAAVKATALSAKVVDTMFTAAGAQAIHSGHPLERALRDVNVARQHIIVQPGQYQALGQALLGIEEQAVPPL